MKAFKGKCLILVILSVCSSAIRQYDQSKASAIKSRREEKYSAGSFLHTISNPSDAKKALICCSIVYGSNYVVQKTLQEHIEPHFINSLRLIIASMTFVPLFSQWKGLKYESIVKYGSELGFWCFTCFLSQSLALQSSSASKVAFFSSLSVIMPPIFCSIQKLSVFRAAGGHSFKISKKAYIASALAICGAAILEWGGMEEPKWSDLLLLVVPFSSAMIFWRSEGMVENLKSVKETELLTFVMLVVSSILSVAWSTIDFLRPKALIRTSPLDWKFPKLTTSLLLLFSGFIATGWTAFTEQKALKVVSAVETSLIYTLEPLFAAAFARIFLKEHIGMNTIIGAIFIISACLWGTLSVDK